MINYAHWAYMKKSVVPVFINFLTAMSGEASQQQQYNNCRLGNVLFTN